MSKSKLVLSILLIIIFSLFLAGCSVMDNIYETLCCIPGMFSLPAAVIGLKLFAL